MPARYKTGSNQFETGFKMGPVLKWFEPVLNRFENGSSMDSTTRAAMAPVRTDVRALLAPRRATPRWPERCAAEQGPGTVQPVVHVLYMV